MKKALLYLVVFAAIQIAVSVAGSMIIKLWMPSVNPTSPDVLTWMSLISNAVAIILFLSLRWCPVSRNWVRERQWLTYLWTVLLSLGVILPLTWLEEQLPASWTVNEIPQMAEMLKTSTGYFAMAMFAPLAEEVVFRGAIIRALLAWLNKRNPENPDIPANRGVPANSGIPANLGVPANSGIPANRVNKKAWLAIIISALFFAGIHMNPAQIPFALVMGCLLGWIFVRTNSIVLCCILHWINNSSAYVLTNMFPTIPMDAPLAAYFGGSHLAVLQAVLSSLLIAIPSLYQLNRILHK